MTASGKAMLAPTEYKGVQIYTEELDHENQAIAMLDNGTTVLGAVPANQDVIDLKQGTLAGISGPVYDAFNGLETPLASLAVAIPPEALADLENSIGVPGIRHDAGDGHATGHNRHSFLADKIDHEIKLEARFDFANADSATQTGDAIDGLLKLASAFAQDESVQSLLKNLEFIFEGDTVTLSFQAPLSEIEEVTQILGQNFSG